MTYWASKLGKKYFKRDIEDYEQQAKIELDNLRKLPANRQCADCGNEHTVWASVNIGVFLCMRCGSHHRGIGTHISIPKGCTGTYLWGPDEIERMKSRGNEYCAQIYGGAMHRPSSNASDEEWRRFIVDKYQHERFSRPTINDVTKSKPGKEVDLIDFGQCKQATRVEKVVANEEEHDFFSQFGV